MPLPDLCLLPHEVSDLAAGEPLCAPADERVCVQSGPRAGDYLVRFLKTFYGGKIIVARRETSFSPLLYVVQHEFSGNDTARRIEGQLFNRLLHFDSNFRLTRSVGDWNYNLVIEAGDRGDINWCSREKGAIDKINLRSFDENTQSTRWRCPLDWTFDTPDEQIENDINRMLRDENSYFSLAHDWKMCSEQEQSRRLARFTNGDWDEFKHRLRQLVLCVDQLDANVEWTLNSRVYKQSDGDSQAEFFTQMLRETHLDNGAEYVRIAGSQARIFKAITRYFRPHWNLELNDLLVRHEIRSGKEINFPIQIIVPIASAHQRLEARLQLRDWLRDKISPDELAELMPQ